jgi:adenylate cyclase
MPDPLPLRILEDDRIVFDGCLVRPLELGRQQAGEPEPYVALAVAGSGPTRLVVARQEERDNVSRHHTLLEPLPSGRVRLTNRTRAPLPCPGAPGNVLAPGAAVELTPPFALPLPGRTIAVAAADSADPDDLHSLDEPTVGPGGLPDLSRHLQSLTALQGPQLQEMVGWLQKTMGVLQATVGAADFLEKATAALVEIVGLDHGRALLLQGEQWQVAAVHGAAPADGGMWQPSRHVLRRVRAEKKTFWQSRPRPSTGDTPSLAPLRAVVAAPITDAAGNVVGALYGERRKAADSAPRLSGELEALLVDLLACGVATGLARQTQEKAALEAQVRFEQFFTPELARDLARQPDLLQGRDAEVTLLFCDVRDFSRFSEKIGPSETMRWMNDVLGQLSACVLAEQGVLVNYLGDGLSAMWGAPRDQPDQAARAVRAGLAMLAAVPAVNQRWKEALGGKVAVGVGINTGPAKVGNIGSLFKFQYGPHGPSVNLASRVEGLTRQLKLPLLVTRATRERLGAEFIARRVVKARVVNIEGPVDLYEVEAAGSEQKRLFFAESEAALDALESGDHAAAARKAGTLLLDARNDGPLLLVLSRATTALMQDGRGFDKVWESPGK